MSNKSNMETHEEYILRLVRRAVTQAVYTLEDAQVNGALVALKMLHTEIERRIKGETIGYEADTPFSNPIAETLYKCRIDARKSKDFAFADELRRRIKALGFDVDERDQIRKGPMR